MLGWIITASAMSRGFFVKEGRILRILGAKMEENSRNDFRLLRKSGKNLHE